MIDLHTHSLLSDGDLLPSELVRRAEAKGLEAIAITDHVDFSNIDFVLPRIVKACKVLNKYWKIRALPGVEITHVPTQCIQELVSYARRHGAKIVIGHGETVSEPVLPGTNRASIKAGVDVLAHPGVIAEEDIDLAKSCGVYLEITSRKLHSRPNKRLVTLAIERGANLVLNTDTHAPEDILDAEKRRRFLRSLGLTQKEIDRVARNAQNILKKCLKS